MQGSEDFHYDYFGNSKRCSKKPLKKRVIQLDYVKIMHWQKQNKIKKQKNKPISKSKDKLGKKFSVHIIGKGLFS